MSDDEKIYAIVDYQDEYAQPLLTSALRSELPPELLVLIKNKSELPSTGTRLIQWRQYEDIDFDRLMDTPNANLANSYVIRKALIRKHFLSNTITHWVTKHPETLLKKHVKPSVEFEVDYAEFLDDALLEAYELKESWQRNEALDDEAQKEWWILKPGMSDRGQGIRLFSSGAELQEVFESWEPESDDEADGDDEDILESHRNDDESTNADVSQSERNGVMTSHLRHFIAQTYVHEPLLLPEPHPLAARKFHIRTYVLAVGALKVYVYKPMLALFAGKPYAAPIAAQSPNDDLSSHLTNTCLQTGEREGSVHAFWSLPASCSGLESDWREKVFEQICSITGEVFEAAAKVQSVHFQPLPNAFEIFGLDFLVDAQGVAWLLEVNAFPDFAQTGEELQDLIGKLFEQTIEIAVKPFFLEREGASFDDSMREVLDIDLGRR